MKQEIIGGVEVVGIGEEIEEVTVSGIEVGAIVRTIIIGRDQDSARGAQLFN